jgi:phage terminase small subunit
MTIEGLLAVEAFGRRARHDISEIPGQAAERAMKARRNRGGADLTPRQRRFVEEYLVDLNGKEAAIRAGYSPRNAAAQGSILVRKPRVAAALAEAQAARAERTMVTADKVVTELAKVAFGDPRRLVSWGPEGIVLRESAELSEAEAALVSEIWESRTAAGGTRKVKLHGKVPALLALAKHLGLFAPGVAAGGAEPEATDPEDARDRLARRLAGLAERLRAPGSPVGAE